MAALSIIVPRIILNESDDPFLYYGDRLDPNQVFGAGVQWTVGADNITFR